MAMGLLSDEYFSENYNTSLSPEEEKAFKLWAAKNNRQRDIADYDIRGFWKSGGEFADNEHGTDKYKKPNHPTFSNQSIYHNTPAPFGGMYQGGEWKENSSGVSYTPSIEMLRNTHPLDWLRSYMQQVEPDVKLNMDRKK